MSNRYAKFTDNQLFERYRSTAQAGYLAELFDRTAPEALRVAMHLAQDPAEAEDLVQATFVRIIERAENWDGQRAVVPWLLGVLGNLAREQRRRRRPMSDDSIELVDPLDPSALAEGSEFSRALDDAIEGLPEAWRPVLVLHLRHGLAPVEIASALGRSAGTVRSQLARGIGKLKRSLPASFVAGLVVVLTPARGLAAMRAAVLTKAYLAAPTTGLVALGGTLAMKKMITLAAALVVLALAWTFSGLHAPDLQSGRGEEPTQQPLSTVLRNEEDVQQRAEVRSETDSEAARTHSRGEPAQLRIQLSWTESGAPAEDVSIAIQPVGVVAAVLCRRSAKTDRQGIASFDDLPAGRHFIRFDRASGIVVELSDGETRTLEHALSRSPRSLVKVIDEHGEVFPGASVWISYESKADLAVEVGETDERGELVIPGIQANHFVYAQSPAFRPCAPRLPKEAAAGEFRVELCLERPAGRLTGQVTDSDGQAIAGAIVRAGEDMPSFMAFRDYQVQKERVTNPLPRTTRTDASGWYQLDAVGCGSVTVFARAQEHAGRSEKVQVLAGQTVRLDLVLERGLSIVGRVTDREGRPRAGVHIGRYKETQFGKPPWFASTALSGADGAYLLGGLSAGELELEASFDGNHKLLAACEVKESGDNRCDFIIGSGPAISGRVLSASGEGIEGLLVSHGLGHTQTDAEGRFHFADCRPAEHKVELRAAGMPSTLSLASRTVTPPADLEIELGDEALVLASLRGRVLDSSGLGVLGISVRLRRDELDDWHTIPTGRKGAFEFPSLPSGSYEIVFLAKGHVALRRDFRLESDLDLGVLQLVSGCTLTITVRDDSGGIPAHAKLMLRHEDGEEIDHTLFQGNVLHPPPVRPGKYTLCAWGHGVTMTKMDLNLVAGTSRSIEVRPPLGHKVEFLIDGIDRQKHKQVFLRMNWFDASGRKMAMDDQFYSGSEVRVKSSFPPGDYRVEFLTRGGGDSKRAVVEFSSPSAEAPIPVWVE